MARDGFGEAYWTTDSTYSQFDGYQAGLNATSRWYQGLWRHVGRYLPAPGKAIDVGCGYGAITFELHRRGFDVTGLDTSEWMVAQAIRAAPADAPSFAVGDACNLPASDYGLIACIEVLEHLPDPIAALVEFKRCLAPDGKLIATTPNLKPKIPWFDPVKADPTHISVHDPIWWRNALLESGFTNVSVSTHLAVPLLWKVTPWLARWFPMGAQAGPGILIVAA